MYKLGLSTKSIERYFKENRVDYKIAENEHFELSKEFDYLIKSPSISLNDKLIIKCKKYNIKVISDLELFYILYPNNYYVCVTGTNGKTSVINNLHQLLEFNNIFHYYIGNMGNPMFDIAGEELEKQIILAECSSFMLESTDLFKPNIYVITNLSKHHLDHHKNVFNYYFSKLNIIKRMNQGLLINESNNKLVYLFSIFKKIKIFNLKINKIIKEEHLSINGLKFNISNLKKYPLFDIKNFIVAFIMFYYLIKERKLEINLYESFEYLNQIKKYPYRFEKIIDKEKLIVINDSKSTNINSGIAALKEMNQKYQDYYLIIGGVNQKQQFKKIEKYLKNIKCLYTYGENRYYIRQKLKKYRSVKTFLLLDEVINDIFRFQNDKIIILFSPMSASFDQFRNFEERGLYFNKLINLKEYN